MKILLIKLFLFVLFTFFTNVVSAQETVRIGQPGWSSGKVIAGLLKVIIEEKLGGVVELIPNAKNDVIYTSMHLGNGEIDVHPDVWLPNQKFFITKYVEEEKTIKLSKHSYAGRSGFCVSKSFSQEHNIASIFDLVNPKIAALTDINKNGQGDIWVGARAWIASKINRVKIRDYGLSELYGFYSDKEDDVQAAISDQSNSDNNYIFYCYEPNFYWVLDNLVMLSEPEYDRRYHYITSPNESWDWQKMSKVKTADERKSIHVAYSASIEERAPTIAHFLKNIKLDTAMINAMIYEMMVKNRDITDIAREWLANNSDRIDSWMTLSNVVQK